MSGSSSQIKNSNKPIVFIMGPTASGKTALAIKLSRQQQHQPQQTFEIISVDSTMIYTQMNIGSAKPNDKELTLAPHHLIDFIDPKESYSVSTFRDDAIALINQIHERNRTPLLVGGSMLYFKALRDGLADLPATDPKVRKAIKDLLDEKDLHHLHAELAKVDQITAERLHVNDRQRITRALEVYQMTAKPLSVWHKEQKNHALLNPLLSIVLAPQDRSVLHARISQRFEQMLEKGFLDEVADLYHRGDLSLDCPSIRSVGYRQFWLYMAGELSLSEAKERAIIATRQLAKRQYTWLRSWAGAQWFDPIDINGSVLARRAVQDFTSSYE